MNAVRVSVQFGNLFSFKRDSTEIKIFNNSMQLVSKGFRRRQSISLLGWKYKNAFLKVRFFRLIEIDSFLSLKCSLDIEHL